MSENNTDTECDGCRVLGLAYYSLIEDLVKLRSTISAMIYRARYHDDPIVFDHIDKTLLAFNYIIETHQGNIYEEGFRST